MLDVIAQMRGDAGRRRTGGGQGASRGEDIVQGEVRAMGRSSR
jgi:hypothetical protein